MQNSTYSIADVLTAGARIHGAIQLAQLRVVVTVRVPPLKDADVGAEIEAASRSATEELRLTCARYGWRAEDGDAVLGDFKEVVHQDGVRGWSAPLTWTPRAPEPRLDTKACIDATKAAKDEVLLAVGRGRRWPWSRR